MSRVERVISNLIKKIHLIKYKVEAFHLSGEVIVLNENIDISHRLIHK